MSSLGLQTTTCIPHPCPPTAHQHLPAASTQQVTQAQDVFPPADFAATHSLCTPGGPQSNPPLPLNTPPTVPPPPPTCGAPSTAAAGEAAATATMPGLHYVSLHDPHDPPSFMPPLPLNTPPMTPQPPPTNLSHPSHPAETSFTPVHFPSLTSPTPSPMLLWSPAQLDLQESAAHGQQQATAAAAAHSLPASQQATAATAPAHSPPPPAGPDCEDSLIVSGAAAGRVQAGVEAEADRGAVNVKAIRTPPPPPSSWGACVVGGCVTSPGAPSGISATPAPVTSSSSSVHPSALSNCRSSELAAVMDLSHRFHSSLQLDPPLAAGLPAAGATTVGLQLPATMAAVGLLDTGGLRDDDEEEEGEIVCPPQLACSQPCGEELEEGEIVCTPQHVGRAEGGAWISPEAARPGAGTVGLRAASRGFMRQGGGCRVRYGGGGSWGRS